MPISPEILPNRGLLASLAKYKFPIIIQQVDPEIAANFEIIYDDSWVGEFSISGEIEPIKLGEFKKVDPDTISVLKAQDELLECMARRIVSECYKIMEMTDFSDRESNPIGQIVISRNANSSFECRPEIAFGVLDDFVDQTIKLHISVNVKIGIGRLLNISQPGEVETISCPLPV